MYGILSDRANIAPVADEARRVVNLPPNAYGNLLDICRALSGQPAGVKTKRRSILGISAGDPNHLWLDERALITVSADRTRLRFIVMTPVGHSVAFETPKAHLMLAVAELYLQWRSSGRDGAPE